MVIDFSLVQLAQKEFKGYIEFAKSMITKKSELADSLDSKIFLDKDQSTKSILANWVKLSLAFIDNPIPYDGAIVYTKVFPTWKKLINNSSETDFFYLINNKVTRTYSAEAQKIVVNKFSFLYVDLFTGNLFYPVDAWIETTSKTISFEPPQELILESSDGKNQFTPLDYVAICLNDMDGNITNAQREYKESYESEGLWIDDRFTVRFVNSNNEIQEIKRTFTKKFSGETNKYYKDLHGYYGITPFTSRTASQFEILKDGFSSNLSEIQIERFKLNYNKSIDVFNKAFFNRAFINDPNYLNYCRIMITFMAIQLSMAEKIKYVETDFDLTNKLYSLGLYEFDDLPLVYKRRLVNAAESLISTKGTYDSLGTILSIFNLEDSVEVKKFFLVKFFPNFTKKALLPNVNENEQLEIRSSTSVLFTFIRQVGETLEQFQDRIKSEVEVSGNYVLTFVSPYVFISEKLSENIVLEVFQIVNTTTNTTGNFQNDRTNYYKPDVGFIGTDYRNKLIEKSTSSEIEILNYENFVATDPYWQADKQEVLKMDFSVIQTKYFSVTSGIDIVSNGTGLSFLFSLLKELENRNIEVPVVNSTELSINLVNSSLFDLFIANLIILLYKFDVDDIIVRSVSGINKIYSTNFDYTPSSNDMIIAPYITNVLSTDYVLSSTNAQSVGKVFSENNSVFNKLENGILNLIRENSTNINDRVSIYNQLITLINSQFTQSYQNEVFDIKYIRYIDWLQDNNPKLYDYVVKIDQEGKHNIAILNITSIIDNALENNIDLNILFANKEAIFSYIKKAIDFFKAYTTDVKDFGVFLRIGEKSHETLLPIDQLQSKTVEKTYTSLVKNAEIEELSITETSLIKKDFNQINDSFSIEIS